MKPGDLVRLTPKTKKGRRAVETHGAVWKIQAVDANIPGTLLLFSLGMTHLMRGGRRLGYADMTVKQTKDRSFDIAAA